MTTMMMIVVMNNDDGDDNGGDDDGGGDDDDDGDDGDGDDDDDDGGDDDDGDDGDDDNDDDNDDDDDRGSRGSSFRRSVTGLVRRVSQRVAREHKGGLKLIIFLLSLTNQRTVLLQQTNQRAWWQYSEHMCMYCISPVVWPELVPQSLGLYLLVSKQWRVRPPSCEYIQSPLITQSDMLPYHGGFI